MSAKAAKVDYSTYAHEMLFKAKLALRGEFKL